MNYIGSKLSLLEFIEEVILKEVEKKENLIHSVIISVILFLTYNIFYLCICIFIRAKFVEIAD